MLFCQDKWYHNRWRNVHKGERCFIVGTGPSINDTNLDLLKGEVIFGVNQCYNLPQLDYRYYCIFDVKVAEIHREKILTFVRNRKIPLFAHKGICNHALGGRAIPYRVKKKGKYGSFNNFFSGGGSVVGVALQIAFCMGFSKSCLIGCDCKHHEDQSKNHFDGSPVDNVLRVGVENWDWVFRCYKSALDFYNSDNREIINCTVGGDLEVFPRRSLEEEIYYYDKSYNPYQATQF